MTTIRGIYRPDTHYYPKNILMASIYKSTASGSISNQLQYKQNPAMAAKPNSMLAIANLKIISILLIWKLRFTRWFSIPSWRPKRNHKESQAAVEPYPSKTIRILNPGSFLCLKQKSVIRANRRSKLSNDEKNVSQLGVGCKYVFG